MTAPVASQPVVAVVTRRVASGEVPDMERDLRAFVDLMAAQPGYQGVQILRRAEAGSEEFTVLARFADEASRAAFKKRPDYSTWVRRLDARALAPATIHELHGLEAWFTVAGNASLAVPPAWKMALITYLGVNVVTSALLPLAPHVLGNVPFPWSNFLFNLPVIGILTWLVMPILTRGFRSWLLASRA